MDTGEHWQWCLLYHCSSPRPKRHFLMSNLSSGMRNGAVLSPFLCAGAGWIQSLLLGTSLAIKGWIGRMMFLLWIQLIRITFVSYLVLLNQWIQLRVFEGLLQHHGYFIHYGL